MTFEDLSVTFPSLPLLAPMPELHNNRYQLFQTEMFGSLETAFNNNKSTIESFVLLLQLDKHQT